MTAARTSRYDLLACLFDYPRRGDYAALLERAIGELGAGYPAAAEQLAPLRETVSLLTLEQVQELYTRTFDINPVCTLEIGWHIYGEDYARGALLVKLREKLREARIPESQELPDHVTHLLPLLARLPGEEADEFVARYLLPALEKMLAGMEEGDQPYRALLEAVQTVVRSDHHVEAIRPREARPDPPDWNNRLPMYGGRDGTR